MRREIYHSGGFVPSHPSGNKAEAWDTDAGTYTKWNVSGSIVESRPLTSDEIAALIPPDPRAEKIAEIEARLADVPLLADEQTELIGELLALVKGS